MNQDKLREQLKIIKNYTKIENKDIAEWLEIKNIRRVSNFLHGDYNLIDEKRRKAEELVLRYKEEALKRIYTIF